MVDVSNDDKNEFSTVLTGSEKDFSHERIVAHYATLKFNVFRGNQISRRQEHSLLPNIEALNEKRSMQLLEQ